MNYGILVAIGDEGAFQIVGPVDSIGEAYQTAREYIAYGPQGDCVAPNDFQVHRRDYRGFYTVVETLAEALWTA